MRKVAVFTVAVCLVLAWAVAAQNPEDVGAIVDRAIKAHGGAANLKKIRMSQQKAKGTLEVAGQTVPFTAQATVQLPDKIKVVMDMEINNMKLSIVNIISGDKGWAGLVGQTKELDKETLQQAKEDMHAAEVGSLIVLKDKGYKLSSLGESKVEGKAAVGVQVSAEGFKDVNLFFDKASGLLVKTELRGLDPVSKQEITQEKIFSDYKDVDGLKTPGKVLVKNDGKRFIEMEVLDTQFLGQVDPSTFAKP